MSKIIPPNVLIISLLGWGGLLSFLGMHLFLAAHSLSIPLERTYNLEDQRLAEALWAAYGLAFLVPGLLTISLGVYAWIRQNEAPKIKI